MRLHTFCWGVIPISNPLFEQHSLVLLPWSDIFTHHKFSRNPLWREIKFDRNSFKFIFQEKWNVFYFIGYQARMPKIVFVIWKWVQILNQRKSRVTLCYLLPNTLVKFSKVEFKFKFTTCFQMIDIICMIHVNDLPLISRSLQGYTIRYIWDLGL